LVRNSLHLTSAASRNQHRAVCLAKGPRHAARPFQGIDHVTNSNVLDRLVRAVSHPHQRPGPDAFVIVIDALLLLFVALVLQPRELDKPVDAIGCREGPCRALRRVAVTRPEDARNLLHELLRAHLLLPDNERALGLRRRDARYQERLAATGRTAEADDVGLAVEGHGLRPRVGLEDRLVAVNGCVELQTLRGRHVVAQAGDLAGRVHQSKSDDAWTILSTSRASISARAGLRRSSTRFRIAAARRARSSSGVFPVVWSLFVVTSTRLP